MLHTLAQESGLGRQASVCDFYKSIIFIYQLVCHLLDSLLNKQQ